jgi:hypothetical protein
MSLGWPNSPHIVQEKFAEATLVGSPNLVKGPNGNLVYAWDRRLGVIEMINGSPCIIRDIKVSPIVRHVLCSCSRGGDHVRIVWRLH